MTATEGIVVLLGRVLFAMFVIRSGIAHVRKHEGMTGYARFRRISVPWDRRLAGWCLAPGGRRVDRARHLGRRRTQAGNFYRNVALLGASLALWFFVAAGEAVRFTLTAEPRPPTNACYTDATAPTPVSPAFSADADGLEPERSTGRPRLAASRSLRLFH
jgi:hypothetical protein